MLPPVTPQAVTADLTPAALFLVLTVRPGREAEVASVLGDVQALVRSVGTRAADGELSCVVGLGAGFWDAAFGAPRPSGLHPLEELRGAKHTAPSTPGDVLLHVRAARTDLCFELSHRVLDALGDAVEIEDEVHGFRYFDGRNLLGFVDGTENPTGAAKEHFALTGADSAYPESSHVVVQRYSHDVDGWRAFGVAAQEAAMGRSKLEDLEIPDEDKAPDAHIALTVVEDADGSERKILRDNMPFGSLQDGTFGTYFIGYAADVSTTETMLRNMFLGADGASHDRILDFSTAHTGTLFFVPSQTFLDDPAAAIAAAAGRDE